MQTFTQVVYIFTHKARRVTDQIRESSYVKTLILLELVPYRAYYPIFKLSYSSATNTGHNLSFNKTDSYISKAKINESVILKRLKPSSQWLII